MQPHAVERDREEMEHQKKRVAEDSSEKPGGLIDVATAFPYILHKSTLHDFDLRICVCVSNKR